MSLNGQTHDNTKVTLEKTINTVMVFINTKTKADIWAHGPTTNNTVLVYMNQMLVNAISVAGEMVSLLM